MENIYGKQQLQTDGVDSCDCCGQSYFTYELSWLGNEFLCVNCFQYESDMNFNIFAQLESA